MNKNILLCGVGGQGTVLASKLIAAAAMKKGLSVMSAETIGENTLSLNWDLKKVLLSCKIRKR